MGSWPLPRVSFVGVVDNRIVMEQFDLALGVNAPRFKNWLRIVIPPFVLPPARSMAAWFSGRSCCSAFVGVVAEEPIAERRWDRCPLLAAGRGVLAGPLHSSANGPWGSWPTLGARRLGRYKLFVIL